VFGDFLVSVVRTVAIASYYNAPLMLMTSKCRPLLKAHAHTFNGPFSGTTRVSRYQKGKTSLDFTEARQ